MWATGATPPVTVSISAPTNCVTTPRQRLDFNPRPSHAISGAFKYNRFNSDRPDAATGFDIVPTTYNPTHAYLMSLSWRWTPTSQLTNEVRGGFNRTYGYFFNTDKKPDYYVAGLSFSDPVNTFQDQGRTTNTYNLIDDAAWQHGHHSVQFGFHMQATTVQYFDRNGVIPTISLGMGAGQQALTRRELSGISTADLADANTLLATLGGFEDGYSQTFNVTSRNSGFINGAPFLRNFNQNVFAFYFADKWRILPRLTLTLGVRWEVPGVVNERDSLELSPVVQRQCGGYAPQRRNAGFRRFVRRPALVQPLVSRVFPQYRSVPGTFSATAVLRCAPDIRSTG